MQIPMQCCAMSSGFSAARLMAGGKPVVVDTENPLKARLNRIGNRLGIGGSGSWGIIALVTLIMAFTAYRLDRLSYDIFVQNIRSSTGSELLELREGIEGVLQTQSLVLRELSTFIAADPNISQIEFGLRASQISGLDVSTISIAAARNLVVSHVYPYQTNKTVLGFDYRRSPEQLPAIRTIIQTGREGIWGPVDLVQGGTGLVLRAPVFLTHLTASRPDNKLWGIVTVVLDYQQFARNTGISNMLRSYDLMIEAADPLSRKDRVLFGDPGLKEQDPVTLFLNLPLGPWRLYATTKGGWPEASPDQWQNRIIMALAASAVLALLILVLRIAESRRRAELLLTQGIAALDDGFVMFDRNDCLILSNDKYREIYDLPQSLLRPGTPFSEIMKEGVFRELYTNDPEGRAAAIQERLIARQAGTSMDLEQHLLNGRIIKASDRPIRNGSYVGLRVDISDTVNAKQAAEAANQAKSDFMGVLSHELRTPLTVILGIARLTNNAHLLKSSKTLIAALEAHDRSPTDTMKLLDDMFAQLSGLTGKLVQSGDHLLHLINEMLDFAKTESGTLRIHSEACMIADIVDPVAEQLRILSTEKGLGFEIKQDTGIVWADKVRTRQILFNLVGNAIKFTPSGLVRLSVVIGPDTVDFEVHDNGPGISDAEQSRVFEAFYQVDSSATRRAGGTGMGLAISRNLAELQGGRLTMTSTLGEGSCFRLSLPAVGG